MEHITQMNKDCIIISGLVMVVVALAVVSQLIASNPLNAIPIVIGLVFGLMIPQPKGNDTYNRY